MSKSIRHRIRIEDAGALACQADQQAVVIVGVERDGTVTVVSYGETKGKCASIGDWAQGLWRHAISAVPFQTVFGWGNRGEPKPLTEGEIASLSPGGRAYNAAHDALAAIETLAPLPIETAPRDGTMLRLLVDYSDEEAAHALEDTADTAWTIGFNNLGNTGEDLWQFAGWCWTHDHFTEGKGRPVAWLPFGVPTTD